MNSLVPYKYMFVTKSFPTFTAPIRPFSSVDIPVLNKYIFIAEGFPTFSIFIRPLSSVDSGAEQAWTFGRFSHVRGIYAAFVHYEKVLKTQCPFAI